MKNKPTAAAIIIAVIVSIIIVPVMLAFSTAGSTVSAVSFIFKADTEDKLFHTFEEEGGVTWIYNMVEDELSNYEDDLKQTILDTIQTKLEQIKKSGEGLTTEEGASVKKVLDEKTEELFEKLEAVLEDTTFIKGLFSYDDINSLAYGIYSALLNGRNYEFNLKVQAENIKESFQSFIERAELQELFENDYLEEIFDFIDSSIEEAEAQLDSAFKSILEENIYQNIKKVQKKYNVDFFNRTVITKGMNIALGIIIAILIILVFVLLISHQLRPSGFITAGITFLLGGMVFTIISIFVRGISLTSYIKGAELHNSILVVIEQVKNEVMTGYQKWGLFSIIFGVALLTVGIVIINIRKSKAE